MGGEFTSGYCISISNIKALGKLMGISGLLGKDISLHVSMDWNTLQGASSLVYNHSVYKGNYILGQLRVSPEDHLECRSRV
ncbi:hypothetical protein TNCV_4107151 [Trichonephila clavipes]|nr:hypothetical protein TNCV_4107151 [Trichonephila clavipes]